MAQLVAATAELDPTVFRRLSRLADNARQAAVLMLFAEDENGPDVLLLRRSDSLGSHPGQVAFPGGSAEEDDGGPVGTALREAAEEVGLVPAGVRPLALLPKVYVPVSGFDVTPVLAYWQEPSAVRVVDIAETAAVARVPIAHLVDPANRLQVRHPSGYISPAYLVPGMLIWGFTASLLTVLLSIGGWDRPWDATNIQDLDTAWQLVGQQRPPAEDGSGVTEATAQADGTVPPAIAEV
ncbi:MAG TPA: CoA pyrophosphatase [Pseudonocardiaceae bacterium]|nr:CoA pyrophosphatase [Pseudonocardiaceae bacterium]